MRTCEREARKLVIEGHLRPAIGRMAGAAVIAKLTPMLVILLVTGDTLSRCVDELPVDVTTVAGCIQMGTRKWEDGLSMIEDELGPLRRQVAGATILEELACMDIGFNVTLCAEPWNSHPLTIDVARFALHVKMAADQNVTRKLMRKERLAPGIRCMASATLGRHNCGMDIFLEMAPFALTWSSLQHAQVLRTGMTASTVEKRMLTLE